MNIRQNNILYPILFSGFGIFSCLLLANNTNMSKEVSDTLNTPGAFLLFMVLFNALGYFTVRISNWLNDLYALNIRKRWRIILLYILVMLTFLFLNYALLVSVKLFVGAKYPFTFPNGGVGFLIMIWLVELTIVGLIIANRLMQNTLHLQQHAAALQKENNTARYTALQNQLNPHFLFNSLNTLIAEIEYNPHNAVSFTKNLSNVYRYVLQCQDRPLVSLSEEIEFMNAYLFLHKVRLGNCINYEVSFVPELCEQQLPPLTLQLLVENVIKHNIITPQKPMYIRIYLENGKLVVSNIIQPRKNSDSAGIGLQNLSNRCELIIGKDIEIINDTEIFTVKIPLSDE